VLPAPPRLPGELRQQPFAEQRHASRRDRTAGKQPLGGLAEVAGQDAHPAERLQVPAAALRPGSVRQQPADHDV
jgi:hypothetical protein